MAALTGHYRPEHVFVLNQNLELFDAYQRQLAACDGAIEAHLSGAIEGVAGPEAANNEATAGAMVPLLSLGIAVASRDKKADGIQHPRMCGASTGTMNVYRIKTSDFEKARALGFVLDIEGISIASSSSGESRREATLNTSAMQTAPVPWKVDVLIS